MAIVQWLIDKSAYLRLPSACDPEIWLDRINRGRVHIATMTRLELGTAYRSARHARTEIASPPLSLMPIEYLTLAAENRAMEVQLLLAEHGQHQAVSIPDLLLAATAETNGLIVLHIDKDFELIAEVTGQPLERLITV